MLSHRERRLCARAEAALSATWSALFEAGMLTSDALPCWPEPMPSDTYGKKTPGAICTEGAAGGGAAGSRIDAGISFVLWHQSYTGLIVS